MFRIKNIINKNIIIKRTFITASEARKTYLENGKLLCKKINLEKEIKVSIDKNNYSIHKKICDFNFNDKQIKNINLYLKSIGYKTKCDWDEITIYWD